MEADGRCVIQGKMVNKDNDEYVGKSNVHLQYKII